MDIRIRALIKTVALIAAFAVAVTVIAFVMSNMTLSLFLTLLGVGFMGYGAYIVYTIVLGEMQRKENAEKSNT
jgi:hypothetical protein